MPNTQKTARAAVCRVCYITLPVAVNADVCADCDGAPVRPAAAAKPDAERLHVIHSGRHAPDRFSSPDAFRTAPRGQRRGDWSI